MHFNGSFREVFNWGMFINNIIKTILLILYGPITWTQSIDERPLLKLSAENFEKSCLQFFLFVGVLSFTDVLMQNCEKWSEISVLVLSLCKTCFGFFGLLRLFSYITKDL